MHFLFWSFFGIFFFTTNKEKMNGLILACGLSHSFLSVFIYWIANSSLATHFNFTLERLSTPTQQWTTYERLRVDYTVIIFKRFSWWRHQIALSTDPAPPTAPYLLRIVSKFFEFSFYYTLNKEIMKFKDSYSGHNIYPFPLKIVLNHFMINWTTLTFDYFISL